MCCSWYLPRFLFRGVTDSNAHGLLNGPDDALGLPIHYGKVVKLHGMTCGVGMVIDGGGVPEVFPISVPKVPTSFTDIIHCTSQMVTLVSVDDTSFIGDITLSLGATNRSLTVLLPLKWTWTPVLTYTFLKLLLSPFE